VGRRGCSRAPPKPLLPTVTARVVKSPKLYWTDSGIARFLAERPALLRIKSAWSHWTPHYHRDSALLDGSHVVSQLRASVRRASRGYCRSWHTALFSRCGRHQSRDHVWMGLSLTQRLSSCSSQRKSGVTICGGSSPARRHTIRRWVVLLGLARWRTFQLSI